MVHLEERMDARFVNLEERLNSRIVNRRKNVHHLYGFRCFVQIFLKMAVLIPEMFQRVAVAISDLGGG